MSSAPSSPMNIVRFPPYTVPAESESRTASQGTWGGGPEAQRPIAQRLRSAMPTGDNYLAASPGVMDVTNNRLNFLRSLAVQRAVGFQQANANPRAYVSDAQRNLNNLQSDLALQPFMGANYLQNRQQTDQNNTLRNQLFRESIPGIVGTFNAANARTNAEAQNIAAGGQDALKQLKDAQTQLKAITAERDALAKQQQTTTGQSDAARFRAKAQAYAAKVKAMIQAGAGPDEIPEFDFDEKAQPPAIAGPQTQPAASATPSLPPGFVPHTPGTTYPDGTVAYMPDGSTKVYQGGSLVPYLTR